MSRFLKYASGATRQIIIAQRYKTKTTPIPLISHIPKTDTTVALFSFSHFCRSYCSGNDTGNGNGEEKLASGLSKEAASPDVKDLPTGSDEIKVLASELVQDVETKELLEELRKFWGGKEDNLEKIAEMVLRRAASAKHEESDEEIMESLRLRPVEDVRDSEFESDFEDLHEVATDINDLYNATEYTEEKLLPNESEEMTAEKWDGIMEEFQEFQMTENAKGKGKTYEQQSLEEHVENMANKLLPEDIKQEIEAKFNELCERCKRGEVEPEETNALFKEFEEKMVEEYAKKGNANKDDFKKYPSGEGPILRWETRVVLSPGGNAFHPKNRRVKVSVSVKELGLSKYAAKRLRAMVGKRYNIGKDELTIVGRRFANREENRKDVLRILYALIEEAQKADVYVREAHTAIMKEHLKTNPEFQKRLRVQTAMLRGSEGPGFV
ncbi:hypothetical protein SUGI_0984360 [Cryptomeria japonica]|uniref:uncharacterized protein LOC131076735 n=1 Tax=Cryptomeria japonica TaxID=3369 RepID=UPI00241484D2|nr:uncharacterized protein LOC131076735 [Cryptomeria japonica]GLJ46696.1 hypothetical protein SUGI_0984360 [Cryptomeria japonica]